MSVFAIKMNFQDALHIGRGADELDKTATTYGSDALKSALFAMGLPYNEVWSTSPRKFFEGFRISSAFPFCGNTMFLPKPLGMKFKFEGTNEMGEAKKAKKIGYVAQSVFVQWMQQPDATITVQENQVGDNAFLFDADTVGSKFIFTDVQQRVAVSADGSADTRPFYFERMYFTESSGLYFLIEFLDQALKPAILHALQLLSEAGIGTDRTVGNGHFEISPPEEFKLPTSKKQHLQMGLGLYLPTQNELKAIDLKESSWGLIKRGGYMAAAQNDEHRSLRKNSIYFFTEGSAFKSSEPLKGKYEDLRPKNWNDDTLHPIWRCGMPLFINL